MDLTLDELPEDVLVEDRAIVAAFNRWADSERQPLRSRSRAGFYDAVIAGQAPANLWA